jgi:hypothetical protein
LFHTIISALVGILGFAAMAGLRVLLSPHLHRLIQRKLRNRSIDEMERNLALFDKAQAARKTGIHR